MSIAASDKIACFFALPGKLLMRLELAWGYPGTCRQNIDSQGVVRKILLCNELAA
jgi:hypothetical protein